MRASEPDASLKLALVHWPVAHGQAQANRRELLRLNRRAAVLGAQVIVNTEMALSGYGFDSRPEIAPLLETAQGPTLAELAALAREYGLYLALGLAERDPLTEAYHNSAFLLGPDGAIQARRRKVTAEAKWACPGQAVQDDCCDTPFGRLGLLICSETYFSLLPRTMALKGVDLLLVPANWPPGALEPERLWRCRAQENGLHLAVCNRSGQDRRLDCSQARSHVFDPRGRDLLPPQPLEPGIWMVHLPLVKGRLAGERDRRLAGRRPGLYHYLSAQLNRIQNLTGFLGLPGPGELGLHCLAGQGEGQAWDLDSLGQRLLALERRGPGLAVLPGRPGDQTCLEGLARLAHQTGLDLACRLPIPGGDGLMHLFSAQGQPPRALGLADQGVREPPWLDLGPARVGLALAEDLLHPELALALAKKGCDLVAASGDPLEPGQVEVLAMRCLERLVVGLASPGEALIAAPPAGHSPGALARAGQGQACSLVLDTARTRDKAYEELVDHRTLLTPPRGLKEASA